MMSVSNHSSLDEEQEQEYLIIKWSLNKIYTIVQNFKCVKLYSIVTCYVNYIKDIGEVIYVGSQEECRQKLAGLNKLNIKGSISNISFHTDDMLLPKPSLLNRLLSTSSKSLASVNFISKNKHHSSFNHLDVENQYFRLDKSRKESGIDESQACDFDNHQNYYNHNHNHTSEMNHHCDNCKQLKKRINQLNKKLTNYEHLFSKFRHLIEVYEKNNLDKQIKPHYIPKIIVENC